MTELYVAVTTDRDRRLPASQLADALATSQQSNVYLYVFGYAAGGGRWAPHGCDVAYTFDMVADQRPDDAEAQHVVDQIATAWLAFARIGDPNHPGMAEWPAYDPDRRSTMLFVVEAQAVDDPWRTERLAWNGITLSGALSANF